MTSSCQFSGQRPFHGGSIPIQLVLQWSYFLSFLRFWIFCLNSVWTWIILFLCVTSTSISRQTLLRSESCLKFLIFSAFRLFPWVQRITSFIFDPVLFTLLRPILRIALTRSYTSAVLGFRIMILSMPHLKLVTCINRWLIIEDHLETLILWRPVYLTLGCDLQSC
jgi:hypothetical protein